MPLCFKGKIGPDVGEFSSNYLISCFSFCTGPSLSLLGQNFFFSQVISSFSIGVMWGPLVGFSRTN